MKYKVNGRIVDAKDPVEAVKKVKDGPYISPYARREQERWAEYNNLSEEVKNFEHNLRQVLPSIIPQSTEDKIRDIGNKYLKQYNLKVYEVSAIEGDDVKRSTAHLEITGFTTNDGDLSNDEALQKAKSAIDRWAKEISVMFFDRSKCSKIEIKDNSSTTYGFCIRFRIDWYFKSLHVFDSKTKDSVKDSAASEIMKEIKKAYPQVKIKVETDVDEDTKGNPIYYEKLSFDNFPAQNNYDREAEKRWRKFLDYIYAKHVGRKGIIGYDYMYIRSHVQHDSDPDWNKELEDGCHSTRDDDDTLQILKDEHILKSSYNETVKAAGQNMSKLKNEYDLDAFELCDTIADRFGKNVNVVKNDINRFYDSKVHDAEGVDYQLLIDDELETIAAYEEQIKNTDDEDVIKVLKHIIEEEQQHVGELEALRGSESTEVHDAEADYYGLPAYNNSIDDAIWDILESLRINPDGDTQGGIEVTRFEFDKLTKALDAKNIKWHEFDDTHSRNKRGLQFFK